MLHVQIEICAGFSDSYKEDRMLNKKLSVICVQPADYMHGCITCRTCVFVYVHTTRRSGQAERTVGGWTSSHLIRALLLQLLIATNIMVKRVILEYKTSPSFVLWVSRLRHFSSKSMELLPFIRLDHNKTAKCCTCCLAASKEWTTITTRRNQNY